MPMRRFVALSISAAGTWLILGLTTRVTLLGCAAGTSTGRSVTKEVLPCGSTSNAALLRFILARLTLAVQVPVASRPLVEVVGAKGSRWPLRRAATYLGLAIIFGYGLLQFHAWRVRNEPANVAAKKVLNAYLNQDIETLWRYRSRSERESYGMSREAFGKFLSEYVFESVDLSNPVRVVVENVGNYTVVTQYFLVNGQEVALDFVATPTPDGPTVSVITPGFILAWHRKYGAPFQSLPVAQQRYRVMQIGCTKEREKLESYGIRGTQDSAPGKPMVSFAECEQLYADYFAKNPQ
jgi:hypothetical protein